jgi:hypothetical protein
MNEPADFIIDQVSWHTSVPGNPEKPAQVKRRFRLLVDFLSDNDLLVRELLPPGVAPPSDFCIRKSDLTEEGFQVMRRGYDRWLKKIVNKN